MPLRGTASLGITLDESGPSANVGGKFGAGCPEILGDSSHSYGLSVRLAVRSSRVLLEWTTAKTWISSGKTR